MHGETHIKIELLLVCFFTDVKSYMLLRCGVLLQE